MGCVWVILAICITTISICIVEPACWQHCRRILLLNSTTAARLIPLFLFLRLNVILLSPHPPARLFRIWFESMSDAACITCPCTATEGKRKRETEQGRRCCGWCAHELEINNEQRGGRRVTAVEMQQLLYCRPDWLSNFLNVDSEPQMEAWCSQLQVDGQLIIVFVWWIFRWKKQKKKNAQVRDC